MYHILIVDEEEHLLWALERNLFPQRSDVKVHTALSGKEGLTILQQEPIDLLISDIKMPGEVDGFQLILRAKEMVPDARVMIITAFGTQRIQNFAERIGISHYIEKPFSVDELRGAILELLDEKEGFQGVLSDLELTDIIQMLCLAKRTALLHLKHRDHRGRIAFDGGEVVHAEFDGVVGAEAVYEMLDLRQGDIFMQSDFEPADRTIDMGWQDMLLEGVRRTDEKRLQQETDRIREEREASEAKEDKAAEAEGRKKRTRTPMGMAVGLGDHSPGFREAAPGLEETSSMALLFSEEELEEMSMASEAAIEEEIQREPEPEPEPEEEAVEEASNEASDEAEEESKPEESKPEESESAVVAESGAEVVEDTADSGDTENGAFAGERKRHGTSPGMTAAVNTMAVTEESGEFELFRAPALNGRHVQEESNDFSPAAKAALEEFVRECPGLRATTLLGFEDEAVTSALSLTTLENFDEEGIAQRLAEVFWRAERSVGAMNSEDTLQEMQILLGEEYVLLRAVENTTLIHSVIVDRRVNLGIALVLMRQLARRLSREGVH